MREIVYPAASGTKLPPSAAEPVEKESREIKSAKNLPAFAALACLLAGQVMAQDLEPGDTFSDELRDGGRGPEMVVIPAGSFQMGCVSGQECYDTEEPVHTVAIMQPLAVSKYEITFEDYDRFTYPNRVDDEGWGRGRRPIINVSWNDAKEYVAWLSSQTGQAYRLLTEAEWEYAARAGSATKYHFGSSESLLCRNANFYDTTAGNSRASCSDGIGRQTATVGHYAPNAFGLYDMHGNVYEWVEDCWNWSYSGAPSHGGVWLSGNCERHVLRGGSWFSGPRYLRSAFRNRFISGIRVNSFGFRVALTLTP